MPTFHHGRHEYGQNFLTDPAVLTAFVELVAATRGPIIEIGPGDGALTVPLVRLGRPVTVIEIDARLEQRLRCHLPPHVKVVTGDFLTYRLPSHPHVVVGNLPFHQTPAMLRHRPSAGFHATPGCGWWDSRHPPSRAPTATSD